MSTIKQLSLLVLLCLGGMVFGQNPNMNYNEFKQIDDLLPDPNDIRTASGAPGKHYWQQKADYTINLTLDEITHRITASETITYHNQSPDDLEYLWLQLDQNVRSLTSESHLIAESTLDGETMDPHRLQKLVPNFDGGFKITKVADTKGRKLDYTINHTMMRIDLDQPLKSGDSYAFQIDWNYLINDRLKYGGRSGYEWFPEDENALYTIAQFFPRMCVYNDVSGWQNKQFLGRGEFTLTFGDYDVKITVPSDHLVASTGTLQNANTVLTAGQRDRYKKAQSAFEQPVIIHDQDAAIEAEKSKSTKTKTWHFKAENVRDFAFASSRKFIWDAMAVKQSDGSTVMAMSMYPKEGNPLWEKYSTKAVAHTLKWYSHYTFDYPYPVAWSIHAARIGMEYPMICFNFGRPEKDGTYSKRTKYGMIGVIIHEVGHNYFPMIVNSDERQWTWMDEGLNSFVQYLTEQQWERNYPSWRGEAYKITDYMGGDKSKITPIMTNSESIFQFGNNAYGKPATALNILRETIMGRELFDKAFKTYAQRWMFKQPTPADFFRTMEDASAVDLDWFWRGWFYTTDHVDLAIQQVTERAIDDASDMTREQMKEQYYFNERNYITNIRNAEEIQKTYDEIDTSLRDFYTDYDPVEADAFTLQQEKENRDQLDNNTRTFIEEHPYFYEVTIERQGGLPMPIILAFDYEDGTREVKRIPAEIWRLGDTEVTKSFPAKQRVKQITLDPYLETADVDTDDNYYPAKPPAPSRFQLFKEKKKRENPMQRANRLKRS